MKSPAIFRTLALLTALLPVPLTIARAAAPSAKPNVLISLVDDNLRTDPGEATNLLTQAPDKEKELFAALKADLARGRRDPQQMRSVYADPAYAATVIKLKAELTRLRTHYGDTEDPKPAQGKKGKAAGGKTK